MLSDTTALEGSQSDGDGDWQEEQDICIDVDAY